jgi:hypothetical protein
MSSAPNSNSKPQRVDLYKILGIEPTATAEDGEHHLVDMNAWHVSVRSKAVKSLLKTTATSDVIEMNKFRRLLM